jgi:DNA-binding PadR family transcriptional regulator
MGARNRQRQRTCATPADIGPGTARALRGATLALICERPGHGYDLAARLQHRLGPAWQVSAKDIYPILDQLFAAGLVRREHEHRRTVYHPAPAAYEAIERWHDGDVRKEALRSDVRARLATVPSGRVDRVLRILDQYEADLLELIEATEDDVPPQVRTWAGLLARVTHAGTDSHLHAEFAWIADARRRFVEFGEQSA